MVTDYRMHEGLRPAVSVTIPPGETAICERGGILRYDANIKPVTRGARNLWAGLQNALSGEEIFTIRFPNTTDKPRTVTFSDQRPGTIVPIQVGGEGILCTRGAFLGATREVKIGFEKVTDVHISILRDQAPIMQKIEKTNPEGLTTVFLMAGAQPEKIEIPEGGMEILDLVALLAMEAGTGAKIKLKENRGFKDRYGSGEGRYLTVVQGPGTIWVAPVRNKLPSDNRMLTSWFTRRFD